MAICAGNESSIKSVSKETRQLMTLCTLILKKMQTLNFFHWPFLLSVHCV